MKQEQSKPIDAKEFWKRRKWYLLGIFLISFITPSIQRQLQLEDSVLTFLLLYLLPVVVFTFIFLRIEKIQQSKKKQPANKDENP